MNLPQIQFKQYDNAINPSGARNLDVPASGFIKILNTSSSGCLDMGYINITSSGTYAGTRMFFFRPLTLGDALELRNFRLYLINTSAWSTGTYKFLWKKLVHFQSGVALSTIDEELPNSLPPSGNVLSTQSGMFIQSITESGCSQYMYFDIFSNTDVPIGTKGGPGAGSFRLRLVYDFL